MTKMSSSFIGLEVIDFVFQRLWIECYPWGNVVTERKKGEEEVQLIRALDYDCHSGGSAVQCWFEALWVLG